MKLDNFPIYTKKSQIQLVLDEKETELDKIAQIFIEHPSINVINVSYYRTTIISGSDSWVLGSDAVCPEAIQHFVDSGEMSKIVTFWSETGFNVYENNAYNIMMYQEHSLNCNSLGVWFDKAEPEKWRYTKRTPFEKKFNYQGRNIRWYNLYQLIYQ